MHVSDKTWNWKYKWNKHNSSYIFSYAPLTEQLLYIIWKMEELKYFFKFVYGIYPQNEVFVYIKLLQNPVLV